MIPELLHLTFNIEVNIQATLFILWSSSIDLTSHNLFLISTNEKPVLECYIEPGTGKHLVSVEYGEKSQPW